MKHYIIFLWFIILLFLQNSCYLKREHVKKLRLKVENSKNNKTFTKNDKLTFFLKGAKKNFTGETIAFYFNNKFQFSQKLELNNQFMLPLNESYFGENIVEAIVKTHNTVHRYVENIVVYPEYEPKNLEFTIVDEYKHNPNDLTQGLIVIGDTIIESTGGYGTSSIKKYNYKSGEIFKENELPQEYFGEGVTRFNGKLYQLTYKERKVFIYNSEDLTLINENSFTLEGWGITNDAKHLIISDGSSQLHFLDPNSFEITRRLKVFNNEGEINKINELEFIDGEIYANLWFKDEIIVIDPLTGEVTKKIDFQDIVKSYKKGILSEKVLNGIAYDPDTNNLIITGKRWPVLLAIKIVE